MNTEETSCQWEAVKNELMKFMNYVREAVKNELIKLVNCVREAVKMS